MCSNILILLDVFEFWTLNANLFYELELGMLIYILYNINSLSLNITLSLNCELKGGREGLCVWLTFTNTGCVCVCTGSVFINMDSSSTAETLEHPEQFSNVWLTLHQAWKPTHTHNFIVWLCQLCTCVVRYSKTVCSWGLGAGVRD